MSEQKWEYKLIEGAQESAERIINERAGQGWEVSHMSCMPGPRSEAHIVVVMRRPRPE